ncbi:hypothetical protein AVEN_149392-1 [Araneus ventricosus]|uniref:Uncharacterized protein n=1 Tax=Araneus ventricosus TaxID=182803 RepID=A0A4Y2VG69_ARAVE|nr:hypothetical protein AVEN_149392-1 [Araneus ventricosus]
MPFLKGNVTRESRNNTMPRTAFMLAKPLMTIGVRRKSNCYEHGMSLLSNVSLMVGKRALQGYVWESRGNGAIDLDLGGKLSDFGDEMWDLKSSGIFLISLLGAEIRIYPDDYM